MTRHQIDRFMWWVEAHTAEVQAYAADPVEYARSWQERVGRVPTPDAGLLDPEARAALEQVDHAALYRLGAHPYLLWHFIEAVRVWTGEVPFPEMSQRFREGAARVARPDHAT